MLLSIQRGSLSDVGGRVIKWHCLWIMNVGEWSPKVIIRCIMCGFSTPFSQDRKI